MFENLLQLVRENADEAIIRNPAIPDERNDEAITTATESIMNTLKGHASSNGIDSISSIFSGGGVSGNLMNNLSSNAVSDLMKKFGLNNSAASSIVTSMLPVVMNKLIHKTNDPNDSSFDLKGILGSLTGGGGGILDSLKGIFG